MSHRLVTMGSDHDRRGSTGKVTRGKMNHGQIVSFIWGVADLIRDTFKRGKYQDVILPLTVLRRLDCVLAPTKEKVLATNTKMQAKGLENPDDLLTDSRSMACWTSEEAR